MPIKQLFANTLSLLLVACQANLPFSSSGTLPPVSGHNQTIHTTPQPELQTEAKVNLKEQSEQVKLQIKLPRGFRTQYTDFSELKFIQVSLKGEGISGSLRQDGPEFLPVTGEDITATISNIPLSPGRLRVITVQGYDSDRNLLGAFQAGGYYRSQAGSSSIEVPVRRSMSLLSQILEAALSNSTLLARLDIPALQEILEQAMSYQADTGQFNEDPSTFDANEILSLISASGGTLPSAADILSQYKVPTQDVEVSIATPRGHFTNEPVRLVLNDPRSEAHTLPRLTARFKRDVSPGRGRRMAAQRL